MEEERVRFITYKGKKILLEDFSDMTDQDELVSLIRKGAQLTRQQPPKSALVLVDMTHTRYDSRSSQEAKETVKGNTPFIKGSALAGITGIMEIIVRAINAFAGREVKTFRTRDEALEWLIKQ